MQLASFRLETASWVQTSTSTKHCSTANEVTSEVNGRELGFYLSARKKICIAFLKTKFLVIFFCATCTTVERVVLVCQTTHFHYTSFFFFS